MACLQERPNEEKISSTDFCMISSNLPSYVFFFSSRRDNIQGVFRVIVLIFFSPFVVV